MERSTCTKRAGVAQSLCTSCFVPNCLLFWQLPAVDVCSSCLNGNKWILRGHDRCLPMGGRGHNEQSDSYAHRCDRTPVTIYLPLRLVFKIDQYTVNQILLVSANTEFLCDVFFMFANTCLHVTSQHHDVMSTLIAIQFDLLCANCQFLQTGLVDHLGVLQTLIIFNIH